MWLVIAPFKMLFDFLLFLRDNRSLHCHRPGGCSILLRKLAVLVFYFLSQNYRFDLLQSVGWRLPWLVQGTVVVMDA